MKNPIVVAVNAMAKLNADEYKTVLALTKGQPRGVLGQSLPPAKARKKPGPKPGSKRKPKAEAEAVEQKFPKEKKRISTEAA